MTVLTPPPERDVPDAVRARVLDGLDAAPRRRWVPAVAAAAAAVAITVPVVALPGDDAPPPAAPAATSSLPPWTPPVGPWPGTLPDEQSIVRRCVDEVPEGQRPAAGSVRLRVVHADTAGWAAWVGGGGFATTCSFSWDGEPVLTGAFVGGEPEPTWAPEFDVGLAASGVGGSDPKLVTGTVARGVQRVELSWGANRLRAVLRGPYFIGSITAPAGNAMAPLFAVAYRADGTPYLPVLVDSGGAAGGPPLGEGLPADDLLLERCRWDANRNGRWSRGVTLRAVFADERGYVAYVGARGKESICAYEFGGNLDLSIGTVEGADDVIRYGYADPARHPRGIDAMDSRSELLPATRSAQVVFFGNVVKGVTRLTVSVNGGDPVEATVRGPYYVARVILPASGGKVPRTTSVLDARRADGSLVGRTTVSG